MALGKYISILGSRHLTMLIALLYLCHFGNTAFARASLDTLGVTVTVQVQEQSTGDALPGAGVLLVGKGGHRATRTDAAGVAVLKNVSVGGYELRVSYIGYREYRQEVTVGKEGEALKVALVPKSETLKEVVVTASESRGMSSASKIGKDAMRHLQPSSFSDLLELLPGGFASAPHLTAPNAIRLREAIIPAASYIPGMPYVSSEKYVTSSLGTTFILDGVPVSNDAGMQSVSGAWDSKVTSRSFLNMGVDMRSLSVDDIEEVEIVRGIPSVEYADLTSGLVKIKRRRHFKTLDGRFKADMKSRLFYLGKGFTELWKGFDLALGADFLNAMDDPRNIRETYKRLSLSVRGTQRWRTEHADIRWDINLDHTGSFDDDKKDPDINSGNLDDYTSSYNRFAASQSLNIRFKEKKIIEELSLDASYTISRDLTKVDRFVQLSRDLPYTDARTEGEHEGKYYPYMYEGHHRVEGMPHYGHVKVRATSRFDFVGTKHTMIYGGTFDYSKNFGDGAIFDPGMPVYPNASARPRPFYDIPARKLLAFFVEDRVSVPIGVHTFMLAGGIVSNALLGLSSEFAMSGRFYHDPRANARFSFGDLFVVERPLGLHISVGTGSHSRFPTIVQMYPEIDYVDILQMNYTHVNQAYRRSNIHTYILHPTGKSLLPARNVKWEARIDADWGGYNASVTCFRETMRNGFRPDEDLIILKYKHYDTSGIDHNSLVAPPDIEMLPFAERRIMYRMQKNTNGSESNKEGVEWMASTPRYKGINTRITFSGAWFRTTHRNSLPQYYRPNIILEGKELMYMGIYDDTEGVVSESLTSDLRLDSHFEALGLGVSLSFQTSWYASSQRLPISARPRSYIGEDGIEHPYTEESAKDVQLQWLIRPINDSMFEKYSAPLLMNANLKTTKFLFDNRMQLALFVNKLFDYSPDFVSKGLTVRRYQSPYFGMEINLKF